ncbi:5'-methylthioadenosine phosphorylase [Marinobacter salinexigens]|uniref:5'-methylthioadenosine phosphorylase n=2 Tax=Marinobacter salinexigens TaxID=2919747 RepID=A0A5B0VK51_9GAMM|nr:5'-methylthioadenosine phosphorylase [Marinobacter salinexigens]
MQMDGNRLCRMATRSILAALLLTFSIAGSVLAQSSAQNVPDDYYRAEFVILERIVDPGSINEHMADHIVEPTPATNDILWSVAQGGSVQSTLSLVSKNSLYLNSAAQRLERSGHYRLLAATGWYQTFPPNYDGKPLRVELGDWLPNSGTREIEGTITVDRQRYLHVGVHLNHWKEGMEGPKELVTWIRETRRMRSEEIHFLDSPTIGVLVFFKKISE